MPLDSDGNWNAIDTLSQDTFEPRIFLLLADSANHSEALFKFMQLKLKSLHSIPAVAVNTGRKMWHLSKLPNHQIDCVVTDKRLKYVMSLALFCFLLQL